MSLKRRGSLEAIICRRQMTIDSLNGGTGTLRHSAKLRSPGYSAPAFQVELSKSELPCPYIRICAVQALSHEQHICL